MARGDHVLIAAAEPYVALRRAMGYRLRYVGPLIVTFACFATERGDTRVRTKTAIAWASQGSSPARREYLLGAVVGFARHLRAEDPRHDVPPCGVFGPTRPPRPTPFIFTREQIRALVRAALRLGPVGSLRPHTYATLFSLLAVTGLRVSEALALRLDDVTLNGLRVLETKLRKSRLVPLHPTADEGLSDADTSGDRRRAESRSVARARQRPYDRGLLAS